MSRISIAASIALLAAIAHAQTPPAGVEQKQDASTLVRPISRDTPQLAVTAGLSAETLEAGVPLSIVVDVAPKKGMHVYAPGQDYKPVVITLQPNKLLQIRDAVYPEPAKYLFAPLKETILVYNAPFRLKRDVTGQAAQLRSQSRVTIKGTFDYQACDDNVCYQPASIPLEWSVPVKK